MTNTILDYYEDVVAPKQFTTITRTKETHITDKRHPRHEGYEIKKAERNKDLDEIEELLERE